MTVLQARLAALEHQYHHLLQRNTGNTTGNEDTDSYQSDQAVSLPIPPPPPHGNNGNGTKGLTGRIPSSDTGMGSNGTNGNSSRYQYHTTSSRRHLEKTPPRASSSGPHRRSGRSVSVSPTGTGKKLKVVAVSSTSRRGPVCGPDGSPTRSFPSTQSMLSPSLW